MLLAVHLGNPGPPHSEKGGPPLRKPHVSTQKAVFSCVIIGVTFQFGRVGLTGY